MIRILVVDDQNLVREGIKILLEQTKEIKIVGEAKDGKEALRKIEMLHPDITLLDIEMPDVSGLVVAKKIKTKFPEVKTIMLSTHEDSSYMQKATSCGAKGYLLKSVSSQELEWSIKLVYQGYSAIKSELLEQQLSEQKQTESDASNTPQLVSFPSQEHLPESKSKTKNNSDVAVAEKKKSRRSSKVEALSLTDDNADFSELETLLTQNQIGVQSIPYQRKQKKKNLLLHGVSLARLKKTASSFEFKLLIFIILFSLGFLVFIALAS